MSRNRASAKAAGARFERTMADYFKAQLSEFIDRRVKTGAKDKGDLVNVRAHGQEVVVELKDCAKFDIGGWINEADVERGNADALAGLVIFKRRGTTDPGDMYALMTVRDLLAIWQGARP